MQSDAGEIAEAQANGLLPADLAAAPEPRGQLAASPEGETNCHPDSPPSPGKSTRPARNVLQDMLHTPQLKAGVYAAMVI